MRFEYCALDDSPDRRDLAARRGPGAGARAETHTGQGVTEPGEVCELAGASALRRLQAAAARGLTRFVGREAEIAALR